MKVSFNGGFEQFKTKNIKSFNQSINTSPISPQKVEQNISGALNIAPAAKYILSAIGAIGGAAIAIANKQKIVDLGKKIFTNTNKAEPPINQVKKHVKKLYDKYVNVDVIELNLNRVHEEYLRPEGQFWPNGVLYHGPNCKGKEKAIEDTIKFLESNEWDIVRMPRFDATKAESKILQEGYNREYLSNIINTFDEAGEKYKQTGKRTAIVLRELNTFTAPRNKNLPPNLIYKQDFTDYLLAPIENLTQNGCTIITDCETFSQIDDALGRYGRLDLKTFVRPLQEDSAEIWNKYLENMDKRYAIAKKNNDIKAFTDGHGYVLWRMQNAIDIFPEQYRESSAIYQKLKDTKFYPFEM